jgi:hypothetical protein
MADHHLDLVRFWVPGNSEFRDLEVAVPWDPERRVDRGWLGWLCPLETRPARVSAGDIAPPFPGNGRKPSLCFLVSTTLVLDLRLGGGGQPASLRTASPERPCEGLLGLKTWRPRGGGYCWPLSALAVSLVPRPRAGRPTAPPQAPGPGCWSRAGNYDRRVETSGRKAVATRRWIRVAGRVWRPCCWRAGAFCKRGSRGLAASTRSGAVGQHALKWRRRCLLSGAPSPCAL